VPLRHAVHWDLTGVVVDPHTLTAEPGKGLAVHLLRGEPEGEHLPLPLLVVDSQVLGEGIVLFLPLDVVHVQEGAAVAGVPRLFLIPGHQLPAEDTVPPVDGTTPVFVQGTLAFPSETQGAVTLWAGLEAPRSLVTTLLLSAIPDPSCTYPWKLTSSSLEFGQWDEY
jgi:hypothetical protein